MKINNNPFGVLYHVRSKTDKDSLFNGNANRIFQGKKLDTCKGLTAWVRWGEYLFRWYEVFWWLGYEGEEHKSLTTDELHKLANHYIGEQPILRLLKKIHAWQCINKEAYFYARCQNLSRAEMEQANKHLTPNTGGGAVDKKFNQLTKSN